MSLVARETIFCVWNQIFGLWPRGFANGIKKENAFKRISCKQIWGFFFSVACSWIEMIVCETVFNSWKQVSLSWQRILQHFTMSLAHEENICLWCFLLIKRCFCKNTILLLVNKNVFIQSHVKKQIYDQTFFLMAKQNCRWKTNYVKKKDSHCCWPVKKKPDSLRLDWAVSRFSQTISWCHNRRTTYKKTFQILCCRFSFVRPRQRNTERSRIRADRLVAELWRQKHGDVFSSSFTRWRHASESDYNFSEDYNSHRADTTWSERVIGGRWTFMRKLSHVVFI